MPRSCPALWTVRTAGDSEDSRGAVRAVSGTVRAVSGTVRTVLGQ